MNSVPLADKDEGNTLGDHRTAVFVDGDCVLKIGDTPGLRGRIAEREEQNCENSGCLGVFQITKLPRFLNPMSQNFTCTGSRSAAVVSKNWRCWKPNIPARIFVGKDWIFVFRSRTTAL